MLEEQLKKFGLSEKEAKSYISLLVLGESTASDLAKESGVNRSSAYVVLEALQKKGLVKGSEGEGVQIFKAAPPEKLSQIAEENLKRHADIAETLRNILPDLKGVHKDQKHRPKVKIYEGAEAIRQLFEDLLESDVKEMRVASAVKNISKILPANYMVSFVRRRLKKGIKMYGIHPDDGIAKILGAISKLGDDAPVLIPKEEYNFPVDIAIFDNKVGLMSSEDGGYSIEIESSEIAEAIKNIFDLAYVGAKKIKEEEIKK